MAKTINFVSERRKKLTKLQQQDKKILQIMTQVLLGVFAVFLVILSARFYFVFQVKKVVDEQKGVRGMITSHEKIEEEYVVFAQKLKQLSGLFGKRKDKQKALTFFSEIFGNEVIVSGIDYSSADEDVVSLTIKAPNVFVMEQVFNLLNDEKITSKYPKITKSSLKRSKTGNYTINLSVTLVKPNDSSEGKNES